jgi:hypothetical protein
MRIRKTIFIILFSIVCFSLFKFVQAAELYLKSSQNSYFPNEIFKVEIRLDVKGGENVTAVEGNIKYNPQDLTAIEFLKGDSILTFIEEPKINQRKGRVTFSGIIPGGYTGRLPGDPGESNLLGTIVFKALKTTNSKTVIEITKNSKILVNAGEELKNNLAFNSLNIKINSQEMVFNPLNELEKIKEEDKIPPEEFKPEIVKIDNQYFLIFRSVDKQSGIDHYEISLFKKNCLGQLNLFNFFEKAESPYPLSEIDLNKVIRVKAVDKAGNERITTLYPKISSLACKNYLIWGIILIIIILGYIIYRLKLKRRK